MIKTPSTLKLFGFLLGMIMLSFSGLGQAAEPFPSKEIRLIVPWNVGGSNDISARLLSQLIAEQGIKVVVENIDMKYMDGKFNMKFDKLQNTYKSFYKKFNYGDDCAKFNFLKK